jgi:hypothetical protein
MNRRALFASAALALAGLAAAPAHAGDVYWSIGVQGPGVSTHVSNARPVVVYPAPHVVYAPPPVVYAPRPVYVQPAPVVVVPRHGHHHNWHKHSYRHGHGHHHGHGRHVRHDRWHD